MGRGRLALRRLARRPRGESWCRGNAACARRSRARDGVAASRPQARRDPRARRRCPRAPCRRGCATDLGRGGQAAQGSAGRGRPRDVDVHDGCRRGAYARRPDGADGRLAGRRGQARLHDARCRSASSARSRPSTSRSTSSPTRSPPRSRPAAQSCSSLRRRRHSRRCCSPSWRTRLDFRPAGSTSLVGPSAEIGDVIVEDERVKLITFTGSGAVGWGIRARAAKKRVGLELGNATPVIVEGRREHRRRRDALRCKCVRLRRPELYLGTADLRPPQRLRRFQGALRAESRGARRR